MRQQRRCPVGRSVETVIARERPMRDDDDQGTGGEVQRGKQRQHEQDLFGRPIVAHWPELGSHDQAQAAEAKIHAEHAPGEIRLDKHEPCEGGEPAAGHDADADIGHAPAVACDDRAGKAAGGYREAYVGDQLGRHDADRKREILQQEARGRQTVARRQRRQIRAVALIKPQHEERSAKRQRYRRVEQRYEQTGVQRTATFTNFTQVEKVVRKRKQAVKPPRGAGAQIGGSGRGRRVM